MSGSPSGCGTVARANTPSPQPSPTRGEGDAVPLRRAAQTTATLLGLLPTLFD